MTVTSSRQAIQGAELRQAIVTAAAWLNTQVERVNALNVFPVPDGDTGTNMFLTLRTASEAVKDLPDAATVGEVAKAAYQAAMMGARGNSGVILSQLLRGFAHALDGATILTPDSLAAALEEASHVAYRGVSRPVEGTILTVARKSAEAARTAAMQGHDLTEQLEYTLRAAGAAVNDTPNQLDVLRKAGVVDSGGEGFRVILEGIWLWSSGRSLDEALANLEEPPFIAADLDAIRAEEESPFGFCTEFLLKECTLGSNDVREAMEQLGESVIAVGDGDLMRVHLHTLRPGQALEFAVDHGTVAKVKIENMLLQHEEFAASSHQHQDDPETALVDTIGVLAVVAGAGLKKVFHSLGAQVVEGGQTMNPSVQQILEGIERSRNRQIIILPNNKNILLTATHAKELSEREIEVLPTSSVPQGISALLALNVDADMATNCSNMQDATTNVHTIEVTRAVRDAEVGDLNLSAGDYMGIYNGEVVTSGESAEDTVLEAVRHVPIDSVELVTIYYGAGCVEDTALALADRLREICPDLEFEIIDGGQPHYPYFVSFE